MSKLFREIPEHRECLRLITNSSPDSNKKVKGTLGFPLLHVTSAFIPYNRAYSRFPLQRNLEYGLLFLTESIVMYINSGNLRFPVIQGEMNFDPSFFCGTLPCQTP